MPYTIQSSERTKAKGSEFETKALLYLMNFRDDSDEIYYYVIDFFNDLTGIDRFTNKMWDVQSKAAKNNYQSDVGKELVTLFKNYISSFEFDYYILFLGGVADTIREDKTKDVFGIDNFNLKSQKKIHEALFNECMNKTYIDKSKVNNEEIDSFLKKVTFVIDNKEKSDYIKSIIKVNSLIIPNNIILEKIFNQIRDAQSSLKNNGYVEGITVNAKEEFIYHNRHLTNHEIRMMVLNRIINNDLMQKGITPSFAPIYARFPEVQKKDILEDCQNAVAKTLFDKNNAENFWALFSNIYDVITNNSKMSIDDLYKLLDSNLLRNISFLDMISLKYFMSIIKDGIYDS